MADAPSPHADDGDPSAADGTETPQDRSVDGADGTEDADTDRDRRLKWAGVGFLLLTGVYSLVIAGQILLWFFLVLNVAVLWLLWRFVVAVERIAAAQERAAGRGTE